MLECCAHVYTCISIPAQTAGDEMNKLNMWRRAFTKHITFWLSVTVFVAMITAGFIVTKTATYSQKVKKNTNNENKPIFVRLNETFYSREPALVILTAIVNTQQQFFHFQSQWLTLHLPWQKTASPFHITGQKSPTKHYKQAMKWFHYQSSLVAINLVLGSSPGTIKP